MLNLRILLMLSVWCLVSFCGAEPPSARLRFPGPISNRSFFARQQAVPPSDSGPYPAAAGPYPAAGETPEPPFELPDRYGPPSTTPAAVYGPPPTAQAPTYGPPPTPAPSYGPPVEPEIVYGPPEEPELIYGPPEPEPQPEVVYGPPPTPVPTYGPPPTPSSTYGLPPSPRVPHDVYGPPQAQPQPQPQPQPSPAVEDNNSLPQSASILAFERPVPPQRFQAPPRSERLTVFRPNNHQLRPTSLRQQRPFQPPRPEKIIAPRQKLQGFQQPQQGFAQLPPSNTHSRFRSSFI